MGKLSNVWVFSDAASRMPEVIAGGAQLGEKVSAFVLGSQEDVAKAFAYGANAVFHLGEKDNSKIVEDYAATMAYEISKGEKPALVLLAATRRGKALAAKLGVQLQAGVVNDASEVSVSTEGVKATHMVYGGLALGQESIKSPIAIVTVSSGVFDAAPEDAAKTGQALTVAFVEAQAGIKCIERRAKQKGGVDLRKARRVVGIGRGIAKEDDIKLVEEFCAQIGAELGCSRPIAEAEKWMEKERYVGVSGTMLKPDFYFAIGISGQIQHMVGVNAAQTIIAVNKDKNAPIFQSADYGIVGDLYKVIPALAKALKA